MQGMFLEVVAFVLVDEMVEIEEMQQSRTIHFEEMVEIEQIDDK